MDATHAEIGRHLNDLRRIAEAIPRPGCDWESRPTFSPPPSAEELDRSLASVGRSLPAELVEFLTRSGGISAMSIHNGYQLFGVREIAEMAGQPNGLPPIHLPEGDSGSAVVLGMDGGGNAFVISAIGAVWRWNHESQLVTRVAETFASFLSRVVADWQAYIDEREGWTYLV